MVMDFPRRLHMAGVGPTDHTGTSPGMYGADGEEKMAPENVPPKLYAVSQMSRHLELCWTDRLEI